MKLLNAQQLKEADRYTLTHEHISSMTLMERAGLHLFYKIRKLNKELHSFFIFCGPGNNGGDGLVLARLFHLENKKVTVCILKGNYTPEFEHNFRKIKQLHIPYKEFDTEDQIKSLNVPASDCIIDALYGLGISRPLEGLAGLLVKSINSFKNFKIAVDIPSGLSPDCTFISTTENTIMAHITLTIQLPKLAFFFAENYPFVGEFKMVDIGLTTSFINEQDTDFYYTDSSDVKNRIQARSPIGHKGTFGHTALFAGSEKTPGAAILSSKAALKSGCGSITAFVCENTISPLLSILPEAMVTLREPIDTWPEEDLLKFKSIGFGPGIGLTDESKQILWQLLNRFQKPLVIDADGITLLSRQPEWYKFLHQNSILTPHPGEFDRLTKAHSSGLERFKSQVEFSKLHKVNVVLKGRYTSITTPNGKAWFNKNGNNGMATAGSGDVLTGIISSLCAQGYPAETAAILGVYIHGYSGDKAAEKKSHTSLIASDIIEGLDDFFRVYET